NQGDPEAWKAWWYEPSAKGYCFIGKDNIPFHTIIWQAELMGVERIYEDDPTKKLNLPYDVPANEFMNVEGAQLSKSRNWAIWLPDILERYDPDAIRYYVASVLPESRDSDFSWPDFVSRNNDQLVATWGNLANRVISFANKHWDGHVPEPGALRPEDQELIDEIHGGFETVGAEIEAVRLRAALQECMRLARQANGYLDRAPWFSVIKEDKQTAATTVYTALQAVNNLKLLFSPFLPFSTERLHRMLGYDEPLFGDLTIETVEESERSHKVLSYNAKHASGRWEPVQLPAGQAFRDPAPLYQKLDEDLAEEERSRLGQ
ncbi:MAG: methionine--tRNA ligase, partial [Anaerolineales bacterium]